MSSRAAHALASGCCPHPSSGGEAAMTVRVAQITIAEFFLPPCFLPPFSKIHVMSTKNQDYPSVYFVLQLCSFFFWLVFVCIEFFLRFFFNFIPFHLIFFYIKYDTYSFDCYCFLSFLDLFFLSILSLKILFHFF